MTKLPGFQSTNGFCYCHKKYLSWSSQRYTNGQFLIRVKGVKQSCIYCSVAGEGGIETR